MRGVLSPSEASGGHTFSSNGHFPRYNKMLNNFLLPALQQRAIPLHRTWFQQDSATDYTCRASIHTQKEIFGSRVISKNASVAWPPRSPDLSVPDFFLWGHVKSSVYRRPVATTAQLRRRMKKVIRGIPESMLKDCFHASCGALP